MYSYLYPSFFTYQSTIVHSNQLLCQDAIKTLGAKQIDALSFRAGYGLVGVTCWNGEIDLGHQKVAFL